MKTQAAVLVETGQPLEILDLEIPSLKPGQTLVALHYSGVCHTQLLEWQGFRGDDPYLPHCLGHEGSGVVVDVGSAVDKVRPGDAVVLSWMKGNGADVPGTVYGSDRGAVNAGGVTTFQRHAVVSENRLTPVPDSCSMRDAALLGCALPTGFGSVGNTAAARPGESIVVFGCGGIGSSAILAATTIGCDPIVCVDIEATKLDAARQLGATHTLPGGAESTGLLRELVPSGFDIAIEATGRPEVMAQALTVVRSRGGRAVVVGNAAHGAQISLDPRELNQGKRLLGTWGGDCDPDTDFARFAAQVRQREGCLASFAPETTPFEEVNDALESLQSGRVVRPLLSMGASIE